MNIVAPSLQRFVRSKVLVCLSGWHLYSVRVTIMTARFIIIVKSWWVWFYVCMRRNKELDVSQDFFFLFFWDLTNLLSFDGFCIGFYEATFRCHFSRASVRGFPSSAEGDSEPNFLPCLPEQVNQRRDKGDSKPWPPDEDPRRSDHPHYWQ